MYSVRILPKKYVTLTIICLELDLRTHPKLTITI